MRIRVQSKQLQIAQALNINETAQLKEKLNDFNLSQKIETLFATYLEDRINFLSSHCVQRT